MRSGDDLVARFNFQRRHREIKRVGTVGAGHAVLDVDGASELLLESIDVRSAYESIVADNASDSVVDLGLDGLVLKLQIGVRHGHRSSSTVLKTTVTFAAQAVAPG